MSVDNDHDVFESLASFFDEGWISEVLFEVKSGKEATVYCCRAGALLPLPLGEGWGEGSRAAGDQTESGVVGAPALAPDPSPRGRGEFLIAAKVHRPIESRRFKNDAIYQTGRMHLARDGRIKRASQNKSDFGRKIQYALWLDHEWATMSMLHDAGADVPQPLVRNERAILMPFLGNDTGPAPNLNEAELDAAATVRVTDRLLWNIELMLDRDRVHGDLSPFNVMYWNERAVIIDFPQSIDPRMNPAARTLLERDIENICRWAAKRGVQRDAAKITQRLWSRFVLGELG